MKIDRLGVSDVVSWVLVACAILTTALVARREFAGDRAEDVSASVGWEARYLDGWQGAMELGKREGDERAPIQVIEFADYQCVFCAAYEPIAQSIRDQYPETVAFTHAYYPLEIHEHAVAAARAAECAHRQGSFDAMRVLMYDNQDNFGLTAWADFASAAGVTNVDEFDECLGDDAVREQIEKSRRFARQLGVRGTPTIVVNGWALPVPPTPEEFEQIVENVLEGNEPAKDIDFQATRARSSESN